VNIVGISGRDRSGKDTLAELYMAAGYFGYSFGDAVRRHARERHANEPDPISVKNLTETSNWLRTEYGADVILKEALAEYEKVEKSGKKHKGIVMFSVRAPIEVDFILENGGELIWVQTSNEVRLSRRHSGFREGESRVSLEEMLSHEALQEKPQPGIPVEVQMDLGYVQSHATKVFHNEGDDINEFIERAKAEFGL